MGSQLVFAVLPHPFGPPSNGPVAIGHEVLDAHWCSLPSSQFGWGDWPGLAQQKTPPSPQYETPPSAERANVPPSP
jgi:hypothetical protein